MSMSAEELKFLELQYSTLRKEIEVAKANMFKLAVGGAAVVPAAQSLASTYSIGTITLVLPLVVVVLVLLFLAENHAMMRAGTFILEQVEPKVPGVVGWETWLNTAKGSGHRTVDKLLVLSFAVLASCYFLVSVVLAARHAHQEFGQQGQYLIAGGYLGVGIVLVFVLYSQAQTDTRPSQRG